jgi:hypothetical protein
VLIFAVFVVVSCATLVFPTVNYMYFYRCVENLRLYFSDIDLAVDGDSVNFTGFLIVSNVEGYSGVKLRSLIYTMSFFDVYGNLVYFTGGQKWFEMVPLEPFSNLTVPISHGPFKPGANVLSALKGVAGSGVVRWSITGDALIFTFLGGFWISFEPWVAAVSVG